MESNSGFVKADSRNLPKVTSELLFSFINAQARSKTTSKSIESSPCDKSRIDYVQLKKTNDACIVNGLLFPNEKAAGGIRVTVTLNKDNTIKSLECVSCKISGPCKHSMTFLFWMHRNSCNNNENTEYKVFWDVKPYDESTTEAILIEDLTANNPTSGEKNSTTLSEDDGETFIDMVLNEMQRSNLTNSEFYSHWRPSCHGFEPIFIHHTMLEKSTSIPDFKSFIVQMESVAGSGLFSRITDVSANYYKSNLWLEAQYCRIKCSQVYDVLIRQLPSEDEAILQSVFGIRRSEQFNERNTLKEQKRFILRQTENIENKSYKECGLFLHETYPYICASPDGIADDHIVEIKMPRTDEEFEKYLVGKETIAPKYMAQMQIQMFLANVQKALFCVLSPRFETNGAMHYVWVQAEYNQVANLLSAAEDFWKEVVFPKIKKIYRIQ